MAKGVVHGGLNSIGSNIKSVQTITTTLVNKEMIIPIQNVNSANSIVIVTVLSANSSVPIHTILITADLADDNITARRGYSAPSGVDVSFQVVEFHGVKKIQKGSVTFPEYSYTQDVQINEVNTSKSIVFSNCLTSSSANQAPDGLCGSFLVDSSTLRIRKQSGALFTVNWQVVEFN